MKEEDTSIKGTVYEISGETDSHGVAILEIKTDAGWLKEKQSETFDIFVLEGGCKESVIIMPNGKSHTNRNTTKLFQMGKNRGILMLALPKQDIKPEQSKTMVQDIINNGCGGKYCITQHNYKQYNCGKLIQEINIRLAGFGGNVPTEEFDERTKKTIMQFQQDYMGVPPSGKICGSLLKAIDEFCTNKAYDFNFEQTKCPCGKCEGYGNGRNSFTINKKEYKGKEYPGMHRSLLFALKGLIFYLKKNKSYFSVSKIESGYRCWDNNEQKGRKSTNHMGCALDLHFNLNGNRTRNVKDMEYIRLNFFCKYMNAPQKTKKVYNFGWEANHIGLEPKQFADGSKGADTWVHFDVREFDQRKYKENAFYIKSLHKLFPNKLIDLAKEIGLSEMCNCILSYKGSLEDETIKNNNRLNPQILTTSKKGIAFITSWETLKLKAYDDPAFATIGYGHLIAKRTCRSLKNNKTIIWPVNGITEQEFLNGINEERATEIFVEDLKIFEEGYSTFIPIRI